MVNDQLTAVLEHTVFGTVQLLADHGYWQFGVVVLIAGVAIPIVELAGMFWLLAPRALSEPRGLVLRTRVVSRAASPGALADDHPVHRRHRRADRRLPGIDDIVAGPGATPLFALIALIMLAVRLFEPRLMWKTAGETS